MAWFYYFNTLSGRLISESDTLEIVGPEISIHTRADRAPDSQMWDATLRTFVARPAKVFANRLDDMFADPEFSAGLARLNATQRAELRRVIERHMVANTVLYNPASTEKP